MKNLFHRGWNKLSLLINQPRLPPVGAQESALIEEVRQAFRELPETNTENVSSSEAEWLSNVQRLRHLVLTDDPRRFLCWDVIQYTMFVKDAPYIHIELDYLRQHQEWNSRWERATQESLVGLPYRFPAYRKSSANLIHQAYHLAMFEDKTGTWLSDIDHIFEFGGGYGSLCRLFFNLGFRGTYIIFDLPAFSALQQYYLKSLGIRVLSRDGIGSGGGSGKDSSKGSVICISDIEALQRVVFNTHPVTDNSLFVATWSLSETPQSVRDAIRPLVTRFPNFLLAYQKQFGEVDNVDYFSKWVSEFNGIAWHGWGIDHLPGNYYLMGAKKEAKEYT